MLSTDGCQGSSKAQETEPQGPDPGPGGERGQDEIISKTRPNSITFLVLRRVGGTTVVNNRERRKTNLASGRRNWT